MLTTIVKVVGNVALALLVLIAIAGIGHLAGPYIPSVTEAKICQP